MAVDRVEFYEGAPKKTYKKRACARQPLNAYRTLRSNGRTTLNQRTLQYDDQHIVAACLRHDRNAQRALYEQYKTPLYRLCLRYARDPQEAEDFLHESFLVVFRDLGQFKGQGALGGWLRRVTINVALQQLRRRPEWQQLDEPALERLPDAAADEAEDPLDVPMPQLLAAIRELPDGYRAVFNLYVVDGFSHIDIARELGISVGASKSQLHKAKALLRRKLGTGVIKPSTY